MAPLPGPGLAALPSLVVDAVRHQHELALRLHDAYGPVVRFGPGRLGVVYLLGEEANRLILLERPESFSWRKALRALEPVDGPTALVLSDGEDHARRRRLVQPAFATRRIDGAVPTIVAEVDHEIDRLPADGIVDLYPVFRRMVRRIVVRVLFGDAPLGLADTLGEVLEPAMRFVDRPPQLQVPGTPAWLAARRARRAADRIVDAEVDRRRRHGRHGSDVLGTLLDTDLADAELRDQVVSLIAAGYDTTSAAMAWTVLELLRTPREWERCRAAVAGRLGDDGRVPTAEDLRALPYVAAVVDEALRLWPPGAVSARRTEEPIEVAGHRITAGTVVVFSPYVTHRTAPWWGDDADTFRPDRWFDGDPPPTAFIPFGGPYRRCLGFALVLTELQAAVVRFVQRTTLTLVDTGRPVRGTGLSAVRPDGGVPVRVEVRGSHRPASAGP